MPQLQELTIKDPHCIPLNFDGGGPVQFPPLRKLNLVYAHKGEIETLAKSVRRFHPCWENFEELAVKLSPRLLDDEIKRLRVILEGKLQTSGTLFDLHPKYVPSS